MTATAAEDLANLRAELAEARALLRLRSQALGRTTAQLTEVRARHAGVPMASTLGDRWCDTCQAVWPCETAQAAGMAATPIAAPAAA